MHARFGNAVVVGNGFSTRLVERYDGMVIMLRLAGPDPSTTCLENYHGERV